MTAFHFHLLQRSSFYIMAPKIDPNVSASKKPAASKTPAKPAAPAAGAARPQTPVNPPAAADAKRKASQSPPAAGGSTAQGFQRARSTAPDRSNNLKITAKEGAKPVAIEDGKNQRYDLVEEIIRKALRMLESAEGIDSLANMTAALLDFYTKRKTPTTWGARKTDMPTLKAEMTAFVRRLRQNFPSTRIETASAGDAYTERFEPIGNANVVDFAQLDMERVELILPADVSIITFVVPLLLL